MERKSLFSSGFVSLSLLAGLVLVSNDNYDGRYVYSLTNPSAIPQQGSIIASNIPTTTTIDRHREAKEKEAFYEQLYRQ